MKLHHKEWPCVILKYRLNSKEGFSILESILSSKFGTWRKWDSKTIIDRLYLFRSKNRYFQFNGDNEEYSSYFEDIVHPRVVNWSRTQFIEYPVYALEQRIGAKLFILISAPYAALLTEIVTKMVRPQLEDGLMFVRPLITNIYEMAKHVAVQPPPTGAEEALSPNRASIILRGGRITLNIDTSAISSRDDDLSHNTSIKSLVLMGSNILKSALFSRLVDEGIYGVQFALDPSLAKVAFKCGNALGVVVKMDQFGNYHFRPGFGGKNLDNVAELLAHCIKGAAIETSFSVPVGRTVEAGL